MFCALPQGRGSCLPAQQALKVEGEDRQVSSRVSLITETGERGLPSTASEGLLPEAGRHGLRSPRLEQRAESQMLATRGG